MKKYLLVLFVLSFVLSACGAAAPANKVQSFNFTADGTVARFTAKATNDGGVKEVYIKRSDVDKKPTLLVSIDKAVPLMIPYTPYTLASGIKVLDKDTVEFDSSLWGVKAE